MKAFLLLALPRDFALTWRWRVGGRGWRCNKYKKNLLLMPSNCSLNKSDFLCWAGAETESYYFAKVGLSLFVLIFLNICFILCV